MSDRQDQRQKDPEERALSGNPDHPPQQSDHRPDNDAEILAQGGKQEDEEEAVSGKAAPDGSGGSDQPGTTLPGYG